MVFRWASTQITLARAASETIGGFTGVYHDDDDNGDDDGDDDDDDDGYDNDDDDGDDDDDDDGFPLSYLFILIG